MKSKAPLRRHLEFRARKMAAGHDQFLRLRGGAAIILVVAIALMAFEIQSRWALGVTALSLASLAVLAVRHRRLTAARRRLLSRIAVEDRREATRQLDWSAIPVERHHELAGADLNTRAYIHDLDLTGERSLMRIADHCVSDEGRARLWARLTDSTPGLEVIRARQELGREIASVRGLRLGLLTRLGALDSELEKGFVTRRLREFGKIRFVQLSGTSVGSLIPLVILQILSGIAVLGASLGEGRPWMALPLVVAIFEYSRWRRRIDTGLAYRWSLAAAVELERFREAVVVLEKFATTTHPRLRELLKPFRDPTSATNRLRQVEFYGGLLGVRQNFLVQLLLNLFWPWDLWWTLRLDAERERLQTELPVWIDTLAEIEAAVSLAMLSESFKAPCWPEFRAGMRDLRARDLRHPLLPHDRAVGNDLDLGDERRVILLTGSNMSGKSTFLRTVGINFVLARAGGQIPAAELTCADFELLSSLSAADSLQEGLSSFYAEVVRLRSILTRAEEGHPVLFLIDEIFRGTNNRERLQGSRTYIEALARTGARGLVSSHDLELAQLETLNVGVVNAHFRESISDGRMIFSYRLHPGACPTTNALEVMRQAGLPVPSSP